MTIMVEMPVGFISSTKLKHFIWCASHGLLAAKSELKRRHVVEDGICKLCRSAKKP